jgi:light-regulated signal transduction histidine kinase (bacteriophytochrome)
VKRYSAATNSANTDQQINGFMNLLVKRNQERLDETSRYHLRVIAESKQEMNRLINALLNLSRVDKAEKIKEHDEMCALVGEVRKEMTMETSHRPTMWRFKRSLPSLEMQICFVRSGGVYFEISYSN